MKFVTLCLLALAFIGCVKIEDIQESKSPQEPAPQPTVESMGDWNRFRVKLPAVDGVQSISRKNLSWKQVGVENVAFEMRDGLFIDESPQPGTLTEYQLKGVTNGESRVLATYQVRIPLDLNITKNFELTANTHWLVHRMIMQPGSTLTTNGHSLKMRILNLESQGGTIQTFVPGAKAAVGARGRNGSRIEIEIHKAQGHLRLDLRGENGGDGADGSPHQPAQALQGLAGKSDRSGPHCGQATVGGAGQNGLKGKKGSDGLPGGNTGTAIISYQAGSLAIQETFETGLGGSGGSGGPGQVGGAGGRGGHTSCGRRLEDGQSGRDGNDGDPGSSGSQGLKETFCLQQPGQKMNCR